MTTVDELVSPLNNCELKCFALCEFLLKPFCLIGSRENALNVYFYLLISVHCAIVSTTCSALALPAQKTFQNLIQPSFLNE